MANVMNRTARAAWFTGAAIGFLVAMSSAQAGPLDELAGKWSGDGKANLTDGTSENIKCNATYTVSGNSLKLRLVCASSGGYKIDANSDMKVIDGFLSGRWTESSKNLAGEVSGSARGNTIDAKLESGGTPLMMVKVVTTAATQTTPPVPASQSVNVKLQQGGHSLKDVRISLTKA